MCGGLYVLLSVAVKKQKLNGLIKAEGGYYPRRRLWVSPKDNSVVMYLEERLF